MHRITRSRGIAAATLTVTFLAAALSLAPSAAHAAELTGAITITAPSGGKVAAKTAKQVILLSVSGQQLSESSVTSVDLGIDEACQGIESYVVTSATTIAVKTPEGGCAATLPATTAGDNISINFGANELKKTGGLFLLSPPAIAETKPVVNENSALLATANQTQRFVTNGGQYVRVKADATYAFDPRSSAGLSVTFAGKSTTELKVYTAEGVQILATTQSAPAAGNYLTFKTASGLSATDANVVITQHGVSKTFGASDTGISVVAAPIVTSLSVTSGKAKAATATVVNGSGFDKTLTNYTTEAKWKVTFCGVPATVSAVNGTGTTLNVTTPDVTDATPGLGAETFSGPCAVHVVDTVNGLTSPLSGGSVFSFLAE